MKQVDKKLEKFRPNYTVDHFTLISQIDLHLHHINYLIIDIDNTLAKTDSSQIPSAILNHLHRLIKNGQIKGITLVSNAGIYSKKRVKRAQILAKSIWQSEGFVKIVLAYWRPPFSKIDPNKPQLKPSPEPYELAMKLMGSNKTNTAVIGDQILTDILGGNLLGLFTIWIAKPLGPDNPITWYKRWCEKYLISKLNINIHY